MRIDYGKFRSKFSWQIHETEQCIFHVDSIYEGNTDIAEIISGTKKRLSVISNILHIDLYSIKAKETHAKYNYWLFSPQLFVESGITPNDNFCGTGSAGPAGIDYVIFNDRWSNHIRQISHEETHLLVMYEVGEAPALLNEGIAVYTESIIYNDKAELFKKYSDVWKKNISLEKGILRNLMSNEFFWSNFGKLPVYTIGGALIFYIFEHYNAELLKNIFNSTHYFDNSLDSVIESKMGISINQLEVDVTNYFIG